jgi:hypothetical protein
VAQQRNAAAFPGEARTGLDPRVNSPRKTRCDRVLQFFTTKQFPPEALSASQS